MVNVGKDHFQKLVGDDGTAIRKPKQGVVSKHGAHTQHASMKEALMTECTEGLMREEREEGGEGGGGGGRRDI